MINLYNICGDIKNNLEGLYVIMCNKVFRDENNYILRNQNFILYLNNIPMVAYINTKRVIHFKALKEGFEVILKQIKTSENNVYKYDLKEVESTLNNPKKEMEISYNFEVAMLGEQPEFLNF